ncbi:MAG: HEAT repeat domain-containing protein [Asgard group archaeon]|nr:HEAT repeat domain-containing protein [Asgard group archaeon]
MTKTDKESKIKKLISKVSTGDNDDVRFSALMALKESGEDKKKILPIFLDRLQKDPSNKVRSAAAMSIGEIGEKSIDLLRVLNHSLENDEEDAVRVAAAFALSSLEAKEEAIRILIRTLKNDKSKKVQTAVAKLLNEIDSDLSIEELKNELLLVSDSSTKFSFASALARIEGETEGEGITIINELKEMQLLNDVEISEFEILSHELSVLKSIHNVQDGTNSLREKLKANKPTDEILQDLDKLDYEFSKLTLITNQFIENIMSGDIPLSLELLQGLHHIKDTNVTSDLKLQELKVRQAEAEYQKTKLLQDVELKKATIEYEQAKVEFERIKIEEERKPFLKWFKENLLSVLSLLISSVVAILLAVSEFKP